VTPFRRLWLAQTVSLLGDFLALFAVQVAIVFRMRGSAQDMAAVFVARWRLVWFWGHWPECSPTAGIRAAP
jgi:hypothetical protein